MTTTCRCWWRQADPVEVIDGGVTYGVLSMKGYVFGELQAATHH